MSGVPSMKTSRDPIRSFGLCCNLGIFEFLESPHHAGQRVVVGDADGGKPQMARLMHIFLRMRAAAQEREIRGDADFRISSVSVMRTIHA